MLPHEGKSKMSANNLAICFSPSFMRSETPSMADIINASKAVAITNTLIGDFYDIFGSEEELRKMFNKNLKSVTKGFKDALTKEFNISTANDILHESVDSYTVEVEEMDEEE